MGIFANSNGIFNITGCPKDVGRLDVLGCVISLFGGVIRENILLRDTSLVKRQDDRGRIGKSINFTEAVVNQTSVVKIKRLKLRLKKSHLTS